MLRTRVLTALGLLIAFLCALFLLPAWAWLSCCAVVAALAAWEWANLAGFARPAAGGYAGVVGALCLVAGSLVGLHRAGFSQAPALVAVYAAGGLFWLGAAPLWLRRKWRLSTKTTAAVVGLIVILPGTLALANLRQAGPSPWVLLAAMAAVWVADIAAYFVGRAFGRRKLAPGISPGKTWEGAVGAALAVIVYGLLFAVAFLGMVPSLPKIAGLVLLLGALTAISIEGDLFESLLKRQVGVKDSGTLLPGHGGLLDRIDSLTSTLPVLGLVLWMVLQR